MLGSALNPDLPLPTDEFIRSRNGITSQHDLPREVTRCQKHAREDSNLQPLVPKTSALSN